jgi:hypothetical protein
MVQAIRDAVRQSIYEDPEGRFGVAAVTDIVEETSANPPPEALIRKIVIEEFRKAGRPVRK